MGKKVYTPQVIAHTVCKLHMGTYGVHIWNQMKIRFNPRFLAGFNLKKAANKLEAANSIFLAIWQISPVRTVVDFFLKKVSNSKVFLNDFEVFKDFSIFFCLYNAKKTLFFQKMRC